jgi:hypothetical protein
MTRFDRFDISRQLDPAGIRAASAAFTAALSRLDASLPDMHPHELRRRLAAVILEHAFLGETDPARLEVAALQRLAMELRRDRGALVAAHPRRVA